MLWCHGRLLNVKGFFFLFLFPAGKKYGRDERGRGRTRRRNSKKKKKKKKQKREEGSRNSA